MNITWLAVGIISFLILAAMSASSLIEHSHGGEIRRVKIWTGIFGFAMLGIGLFVGLLVCIQKTS
jgi:hypothetical protein